MHLKALLYVVLKPVLETFVNACYKRQIPVFLRECDKAKLKISSEVICIRVTLK